MPATEYLIALHTNPHSPLPSGVIESHEWAESFLGAIRDYRDAQIDREAQRAAERFGKSATKDRYRFIWELWQNADDAGASTLRFVISDGELRVENDGRPLSSRDVYSMCFVASSQKEGDIAQKGQFGIGLLSLMRVCTSPEVHSGPFHFRLDRTFTYPSSIPSDSQSAGTRIVAPLVSRTEGSKLFDVLVARAEEEVLLYMSNLRRVEVVDEDGDRTHSIECKPDTSEVGARTVQMGSHVWLKYKTTIHPPADLQRDDGEPVSSDIPIVMVRSETVEPPHRVSSFFPTAVEHHLPWRFSAPFEVTNSREALLDSEFNRWLLAEVGKAMVSAALDPKVGDNKAPWRLVPGADIRESDLALVYESAHDVLRESAWVPTVTGLRKPSAVAIPASSALRRLIKPEDVPDDEIKQRAWIRHTPDRVGIDLLDSLGAMELCCHELSQTLALGQAREATWYLKAAAETLRLASKEEWDDAEVFARLRDGLCFKDQRNRPFSLAESTAADKVVCSTRGEGLAKELGRLANRWIVMLHEVYREPRSKRKASSDLTDARKLVDRWLTDESEQGWFSYEHALEAPQFIERFIAEREIADFADLDAPTHQSLLTLVRDHMRGYRGRYRNADNQLLEIGRRIQVDAFSIDETGARINALRPVGDVYLGSTYSKSEWTKAASGAPGIWWMSSRYARLLKRKDEDGVVGFLRSLGAADGPRVQAVELSGWHGRHQFAPVLHGDASRHPHFPHDQRKFGYYTSYGTRGDHESPDIDAALAHISSLAEGARRARAAQLYRTIERSWETLSANAFASAYAYASNSESFMGRMPARWLYNLRIASWIKFGDGTFAPPQGRVASTAATRAVLGAKDPEMTVWECVNDSFAEALGLHTKASTRGIIGRLRDLQQHDATIPIERAAAYFEALVPAIESEPGELGALQREPLIYHPTTNRKWWPADLCMQTDHGQIFGSDRAYLTRFPRAKELWRYLAIPDEPRLTELAKWWRELEHRAELPQPALQRQLEHSYKRAEDAWGDADRESVPVLAEGEWQSSNRVVATDDDALWIAIPQFDRARWDQESPLRFQGFCRWAGMIVLEDYTEFGPPPDDGTTRADDTKLLHKAVKAFAAELAVADPPLWQRLAPFAEEWIGLQVEEVPRLEVAARVTLPGAAPIEVLVRRTAVVSPSRLVLSSLTNIDSVDVVRCLLKGVTASAPELMLIENGVRIRLLERAQIDWSEPDISGLPGRASADGNQEFDGEDPDVLLARYASNTQPEDPTAPEPTNYPDVDEYVVLSDASADGEAPVGGQVPGPVVTIKAPGSGGEGKRPKKRTQRAVLSVEQQGLEFYIRYVLAPGGIQVSDQRLNKGVGADLVCSDGIFRELKTFSGPAPDNVKLTSHERARAAAAGSGYELVIVENIERVEVAISIIPRPLEVLEWYPAGDVQVTGWRANVVAGKFRQLRLGAKPTLEHSALAPVGPEGSHD